MDKEMQCFECHGHLVMDGVDFASSRDRHVQQVDRGEVERALSALQRAGVCYYRDGGDAQGVSLLARQLAPDYGIELVTPGFAIHRKGFYGGLVGRAYADKAEYLHRLSEL
ncbi:MAG: Xaa-Pro dipeptidase, partial [Oscillospiraceae bacterium]|nr:Xaa-Pro dipeptidase [Oscillospiraceae bacterium]